MITIQERLNEFKSLSFEDQKARILQMLEGLKSADDLFGQLLNIIQNNENVDADFLAGAYSDIATFADAIAQHDKQKAENVLSSLQEKIRKIREIENVERAKENPDAALESELNHL